MMRTISFPIFIFVSLTLTGCALLEGFGARSARDRTAANAALPSARPVADIPDTTSDTLPHYEPLANLTGNISSIGDATTTNLAARAITEFRRIYPAVT